MTVNKDLVKWIRESHSVGNADVLLASQLDVRDEEIASLKALVKDAFIEGFSEGMKEVQTSLGGNNWHDSRSRKKLKGRSDD